MHEIKDYLYRVFAEQGNNSTAFHYAVDNLRKEFQTVKELACETYVDEAREVSFLVDVFYVDGWIVTLELEKSSFGEEFNFGICQ